MSQPEGGFVRWLQLPEGVDSRVLFAQTLERGLRSLGAMACRMAAASGGRGGSV